MAKTKIVATFGPASEDPSTIQEMVGEGIDCARINLSHGTKDSHRELVLNLKRVRSETRSSISIIADTKGPEVRLVPIEEDTVILDEGRRATIVAKESSGHGTFLIDYEDIAKLLSEGDQVIIGDGDLSLAVESIEEGVISCRALNSGEVTGRKKVTIPGTSFPLPPITEEDREDIEFAVSEGVDWLALSFVKDEGAIKEAREIIRRVSGETLPIIAKIETVEAVQNIESIAREADGLMVARGDLAMAIGMEEVPFLQKEIIRIANNQAVPVITATQMLETMIDAPTPTRAEITDVANAVLDGTDALMLSGETAIGSYPVKTVATMRKIAEKADSNFSPHNNLDILPDGKMDKTAPEIGRAACSMADRIGAKAIITSTRSGYTGRLVARFRPRVPIIAVTPSRKVFNQLALVWGVQPVQVETTHDTDKMIAKSIRSVKDAGYVQKGDLVIVTAGVPFAVEGTTNLIKVEEVA